MGIITPMGKRVQDGTESGTLWHTTMEANLKTVGHQSLQKCSIALVGFKLSKNDAPRAYILSQAELQGPQYQRHPYSKTNRS